MTTINHPLAVLVAALNRRDVGAIGAEIDRLLAEAPALDTHWLTIARVARANGEAGQMCDAILRFSQDAPDRYAVAAAILAEGGRFDAAMKLAAAMPPSATRWHLLGTLHAQIGDDVPAIEALRQALALDPTSGPTWLALSAMKKFTAGDADIAAMTSAARPGDAPMLHAISKAFDDIGAHDRAFAAVAAANAAQPRPAPGDGVAARIVADFAQTIPDAPGGASRAIFVMGLPRSGTTLVEQILAAHSGVDGGGELNLFSIAAAAVPGPTARDALAYRKTNGNWVAVRDRYHQLIDVRFGGKGRIVDKSLGHGRLLGLIASIFPDAPLIWVRRDPLDTAWSCYRTYFAEGLDWSRDLSTIAEQFNESNALLRHWQSVLGSRLHVIDYHDLVDDFDGETARLLAHCGLPPEPKLVDFHLLRRPVITASVNQVRRSLNRDGIGSSAPYRQMLAAFTGRYRG
jgi:tetratricopeptide (TPR) repeat protein